MRRMMLYDRLGNPLGELAEADVFEAVLREEINGEHSLTITTTRVLDKGIRLLYEDGRSKWREFAVAGVDAEHASGDRAIGTYYCVWSMQEDLQGSTVSVMPGVQNPTSAGNALTSLLSGQSRWARGTVTEMSTGGASMYDRSAWEALSTLVEVWGGEVDATIEVGLTGVTARKVDLYAEQGEQTAYRRFDFGADLQSVKRTLPDDPLFCRISPRGKGEETDAGGYGRKITIASVNQGKDWLEYAPMVDAAKLPDGQGGYEYPTLIVENSDCETPADLKTWAQGVLEQYCTPKVTYEIDVLQAGIEGVDVTGVSLGDAVQIVDRKFGGDDVRVQGRVRSIVTDLLNERDVRITIGDAVESVAAKFADVGKSLVVMGNDLTTMSTAEYIDNLLQRINTEINATGGYTYIVPGNGILTFDVAVADPLNPTEASQVVEVKGGSIRIANSKTAQGAWEWKSVFTSGHIAASLVTAANLVTGKITSADGYSYWDLDSNVLRTRDMEAINMQASGTVTTESTNYKMIVASGSLQPYYRDSESDPWTSSGTMRSTSINGNRGLNFISPYLPETGSIRTRGEMIMTAREIWMYLRFLTGNTTVDNPGLFLNAGGSTFTDNSTATLKGAKVYITANQVTSSRLSVDGAFSATGTKSRLVSTKNYDRRLLYSYETPSPIFGDLGSGAIGDDGLCYVEIDDIFTETARTDIAYQVFLQKCGQGDLWIAEKHPAYFVVQGTPGLVFDWELKARQADFEHLRLENEDLNELNDFSYDMAIANIEAANVSPIEEIESLYAEELGL